MIEEDKEYIVYTILGKVGNENQKLQYKSNWLNCFEPINAVLNYCSCCSIQSQQAWIEVYKIDKKGTHYVKAKNAPTGKILNWNKKNFDLISDKYLTDHLNILNENYKKGITNQQWLDNLTIGDKYLSFIETEIRGNFEINSIKNIFNPIEFLFKLSDSREPEIFKVFNQQINIYFSLKLFNMISESKVNAFLRIIFELAYGVFIAKSSLPLSSGMIGTAFGFGKSLELKRNPYSKWETISFNKNCKGE